MIRKILFAAFACASVFATAQSASSNTNGSNASAAGSVVPASATAQNMAGNHKDGWNAVNSEPANSPNPSDTSSGPKLSATKTNGTKTMHEDSWDSKRTATSNGNTGTQVVAGDVNQDGTADRTNPASNGNGQDANTKNSQDQATGQANGKQQQEPVSTWKKKTVIPKL